MDEVNLIRPNTFAEIIIDDFEKEHNIKRGDVVFVISTKAYPISEDDPYTQRVLAAVHTLKEDGNVDLEGGFFMMDPASMAVLSKDRQDVKFAQLEKYVKEVVGSVELH